MVFLRIRNTALTSYIITGVVPRLSLAQHSYQSHPEFLVSDHKPVSASFTLSVFSAAAAKDELMLPAYAPVVRFFPPQVRLTK